MTFQGNSIDLVSTAKWDADKLPVSTKMDFGSPVEVAW
jgi:hypothetical protein